MQFYTQDECEAWLAERTDVPLRQVLDVRASERRRPVRPAALGPAALHAGGEGLEGVPLAPGKE